MGMKEYKTEKCMGYSLYSGELNELSMHDKLEVNTINQYSYCIAEEDPDFKEALLKADVLLPDGIGMVWAAKFLHGVGIKKIAGADLHEHLLRRLQDISGSCFYLGASPSTLEKIEERLGKEYPKVRVGSYSPPFKKEFSQADSDRMVDEVNAFAPMCCLLG